MKVSIVIPVYNVEKYLEKCLESVVNQTLKDIEIICINDGSTDCSLNILRKYEKKYKNIVVISQENKGLSGARNTGIKVARGEYIYFLDSDDYIALDAMEICYNKSKENDLDILTFDSNTFYSDGYNEDIKVNIDRSKVSKSEILEGRILFKKFYDYNLLYLATWLNFYKRDFLLKIKNHFCEGIVYEDILHTIKSYTLSKKVMYISNKLHFYRRHNNSITTKHKNIYGHYISGEELYKFYKLIEESIDNNTKDYLVHFIKKCYSISITDCDRMNEYYIRNEVCQSLNLKKEMYDVDIDIKVNSLNLFYNRNNILLENKNLFIVHTPYHILLAISICKSDKYKLYHNEIFINDTFNISCEVVEKLKLIFDKVYILNDRLNIKEINRLIGNNKYAHIFINNESEIQTQYILQHNIYKTSEIIYIEDGSACYLDYKLNGFDNYTIEKYNELLNINIENIKVFGTYSKIKERYFMYSKLIRKDLKDGKISNEIDTNLFKQAIDLMYGEYFTNYRNNLNKNAVIILENSKLFEINKKYNLNKYIEIICEIIELFLKNNINVYIKYHPREYNRYIDEYMDQLKHEVIEIDSNVAVEVLYKIKKLYVVSLKSTALITYSKLIEQKNIICIDKLLNEEEDDLLKLFRRLNIFIIENMQEVKKILKVN